MVSDYLVCNICKTGANSALDNQEKIKLVNGCNDASTSSSEIK